MGSLCAQQRAMAPSDSELDDRRSLQWLRSWIRFLLPKVSKNWAEKTYAVDCVATVRMWQHKQRILLWSVGRFLWVCSTTCVCDTQNQSFPKKGHCWAGSSCHCRGAWEGQSGTPHCMSSHMAGKGELVGQLSTSPQASLHASSWNGFRSSSSKRCSQESWPLHRQLSRTSPIWWTRAWSQQLAEVGAVKSSPGFCSAWGGWLWSQPCFASRRGMSCSGTISRLSWDMCRSLGRVEWKLPTSTHGLTQGTGLLCSAGAGGILHSVGPTHPTATQSH